MNTNLHGVSYGNNKEMLNFVMLLLVAFHPKIPFKEKLT